MWGCWSVSPRTSWYQTVVSPVLKPMGGWLIDCLGWWYWGTRCLTSSPSLKFSIISRRLQCSWNHNLTSWLVLPWWHPDLLTHLTSRPRSTLDRRSCLMFLFLSTSSSSSSGHSSTFQRLKICFPDKKCFLSVRAAHSSPVHRSCCSISTSMGLTCREDSRAERGEEKTLQSLLNSWEMIKNTRYDCWVFYESSELQLINRLASNHQLSFLNLLSKQNKVRYYLFFLIFLLRSFEN